MSEPLPSHAEQHAVCLETIFREHAGPLYRYIYGKVGQAALAEDLTSTVFLRALRWLQQERGPRSVRGWLYATARMLIADHRRQQEHDEGAPAGGG